MALLKQAAVRSLSCEVVPGKEGQMYFGDEQRGHVLSYTFMLQDAQARGFYRWYSLVVWADDKHSLLNAWSFFEKHMKQLVVQLQHRATQVFESEQNACPQRALRLSSNEPNICNKTSRSLLDLTGCQSIFLKIHLWFVWLMAAYRTRLSDAFIGGVFELSGRQLDSELWNEPGPDQEPGESGLACTRQLQSLRMLLGAAKFQLVSLCVLSGCQLVVRGPKHMVLNTVHAFKFLLPRGKCRCLEYLESYEPPSVCNLLGLSLSTAVPLPTPNITRLDMVPPNTEELVHWEAEKQQYSYVVRSIVELPEKLPSLVQQIDTTCADQTVSDMFVHLQVSTLLKQWAHTADVVREARSKQSEGGVAEPAEVIDLMQSLGVQEQDMKIINFWT